MDRFIVNRKTSFDHGHRTWDDYAEVSKNLGCDWAWLSWISLYHHDASISLSWMALILSDFGQFVVLHLICLRTGNVNFANLFERADIFISDNALWGLAQQQEWNRCTCAMRPQNLSSYSKQFEPCCPYLRLTLWLLNPPTRFKKRWATCVKHLQIWIIGVENRRYSMQNQDTMHTISSRISMQVAINPGKILVITLGCMAGKQWTSITRANRVTGIMMSFSYKVVGTNVSRQELGVNFPFRKERRIPTRFISPLRLSKFTIISQF